MYLDRRGLDMRLCNVTDMIQRYYGATHVPPLQLLSRPVWITEVILEVLLLLRLQVEFLKLLCDTETSEVERETCRLLETNYPPRLELQHFQ